MNHTVCGLFDYTAWLRIPAEEMNFENDYMQIFDLRDLDLDFGWDHTTNLRVSLTGLYIQLENFLCTDGRRASLQLCTI